MREAGDGFLWPNVMIIPEGLETRVYWGRDREFGEFAPIRFISEGEVSCPTAGIERSLTHLVTSVLDRLVEQGVTGTPLEKEWKALTSLEAEEREYCIAAAKLGLDPFAEADEFEMAIIEAAQRLPVEILGVFFDAVEPVHTPEAVEWITAATQQAEQLAGDPSREIGMVRDALASNRSAISTDVPWRLGWRQAQVARQSLGLANDCRIEIENFVPLESRLGIDPRVQAVGVAPGYSERPAIVLGRPLSASSRRFVQGRALWHRIARDEPSFLITTSYTDLQKIERAFSAELLAPAEGIKSKLEIAPNDAVQEDLGSVADYFGVSPILIEHQIENQILSGRR